MSTDRPQLKEVNSTGTERFAEPTRPMTAKEPFAEPLADLDRIREILYGAERRESDERISALERRLESEANRAQAEAERRAKAFEDQMRQEVRSMVSEVGAEQRRQGEAADTAMRGFKATVEQIERNLEVLAARADTSERELRDQLKLQIQSLTDLMRMNYDEMNGSIERISRELRSETVDWAGLSNVLQEVAKQVSTRRPTADVLATRTE